MFHNAASEEMLLFNNFRPVDKADVQKALKFRYTKLLNKWLFDNQRAVKILIRDTLGKHLEKKVDKHDLFGFVFLKSEYSIPLAKIPNYVDFFRHYLQFGVYFKVPCPTFLLSQDEKVSLLTEAETVNPKTVLWLVNLLDLLLPPRLYHQYRSMGMYPRLEMKSRNSKFNYICELIDMGSPYYTEIVFDAVIAMQLAMRYSSEHYLQHVKNVTEADIESVTTPSPFRFALIRKYVEFNSTCKYEYLCELIDNNIEFDLSMQYPITLLRLTLQYNSPEYLQYATKETQSMSHFTTNWSAKAKITAKDCQNITQPILRVAVVKKYLECNEIRDIISEVNDMDKLFKGTLKSILGLQLTQDFCSKNMLFIFSNHSDFEWAMYKYRRFRLPEKSFWRPEYKIIDIYTIRNFTEEWPDNYSEFRKQHVFESELDYQKNIKNQQESLRILEWFRLGEGQPITWYPEYMFDLNLFDQNVIKTLMTLQLIPECILNCLPNELIFTIFDIYMFSFKK